MDNDSKRPYEPPVVVVHGDAVELTRTGLTGALENQAQAGSKKRNSLG